MPDNDTGSTTVASFRERYGPWGLISGASDGTGAAYARQLAQAGLNLVLVARRLEPLEELAAELEASFGIETRTASVDLYQEGAAQRVLAAAAGLEIGLYVSNAGADTIGKPFLDAPFESWRALITRNVLSLTEVVYDLAGKMKPRGRGGLILMSSGTALGGQAGVAVYSATKAFDLNLAESLWMDLKPYGIDVIGVISPVMDTPSLRRVLAGRDIPNIHDPSSVVRTVLQRLGDGPSHAFSTDPTGVEAETITAGRRRRVEAASNLTKMFFSTPVS